MRRCTQVKQLDASELRRSMLQRAHAYVLAASTAIYVWHGRSSTVDARQAADAWARRVRPTARQPLRHARARANMTTACVGLDGAMPPRLAAQWSFALRQPTAPHRLFHVTHFRR